jgi:hypothetical protein
MSPSCEIVRRPPQMLAVTPRQSSLSSSTFALRIPLFGNSSHALPCNLRCDVNRGLATFESCIACRLIARQGRGCVCKSFRI